MKFQKKTSIKRREPIRKLSELGKVKKHIQEILLARVRARDGGCIFRTVAGTDGIPPCQGPTTADHIEPRWKGSTFADPENVVCVCWLHHFRWKPQNAQKYTQFVRNYIGEERYQHIVKKARKRIAPRTTGEWEVVAENLRCRL